MHTVKVIFKKKTEVFGIEVVQELPMVDNQHAQSWIKSMGNKIWDIEVVNI